MPRFDPFIGVRYDARAVELDQVIAPPYDIVDPAERGVLAGRSPYNAIHLELPEPRATDGLDRYAAAADLLRAWTAHGVLAPDGRPAFYPYRMTAKDGTTTTGVLGALGIGDGVLPHEETMPKPKSDRLDLLRATQANVSPIWGLSLAPGVRATFDPHGPPALDATDDDGVRHQLWVLDDPGAVRAVADAVARAPVVLADGHHRYETARTYRSEVRAANGDRAGDHDLVMALVVELAQDELHVQAIHRLLRGVPAGTDVASVLASSFEVAHAGPPSGEAVEALVRTGAHALVGARDVWALRVREGAVADAGTDLVTGLVDRALRAVPEVEVDYEARLDAVLALVRSGDAQYALVLQPVTVAQISAWAGAGRRMPPKTTYFSPKPRTGMVIRVLSGPEEGPG